MSESSVSSGTSTAMMGDAKGISHKGPNVLGDTKKRKNKKKEKEMEESYKIYEENNQHVFEFLKEEDYSVYMQGYKKNSPRAWRYNETTSIMLENLNKYKSTGFIVKYDSQTTNPLRMNNTLDSYF